MSAPQHERASVTETRALPLLGTGLKRSWTVSAARVIASTPVGTASTPGKIARLRPTTAERPAQ